MLMKSKILSHILRTNRRELHTIFWFCFAINVLLLAIPLYSMQMFDRVISSRSIETMIMLTIIVVLCLIVQAILTNVRQTLLQRLGEKVETQMADSVINASVRQAIVTTRPRNAQGVRDVQAITGFFASSELTLLLDLPWVPLYLAIMYLFDPALGHVTLLGIIIILLMAFLTEMVAGSNVKAASTAMTRAAQIVDMIVRQAEAVYSMGMIGTMTQRWQREQRGTRQTLASASDRINIMTNITRLIRMLLQVAVMVVAVIQVLNASITPGGMIVTNILLAKALAPIEGAIATWKALANMRAALERVEGMVVQWFAPPRKATLLAPSGSVTCEQVAYVVPGSQKPILRGITMNLMAGHMLGVVGASGAGKTTLGRALANALHPTSGTVRLDGAAMGAWDPDELGPYIGYLPQSIELFNGTIADNICRFTDASTEDIVAAAKLAGVHDLILQFRQGYDTPLGIGEGAVQLSGGQRQRIGLARAFFGNPKLIVLDEPNANLDGEGEKALVQALALLKSKGTTVIIIAHRPSVLVHCDYIMVMKDGGIDAFGSIQEIGPKLGLQVSAQNRPRIVAGTQAPETK